ncbi:MAG TPA: hypothetical protein VGB54_04830 [Allosphingosinicella sp.]
MRLDPIKAAARTAPEPRELIWLVGQPPLTDYLDFVRKKVVGGSDAQARALVDEWRIANDHYHDLSESEAGIAERIKCRPLPRRLAPLEQAVRANAWFRHSFSELPVTFAMVELDKLIVSQTHVERGHHDAVAAAIGRDLERRFHFCIPLEREPPPVDIRRLDDHRWLFSSASTDFRERAPMLIRGDRLRTLGVDGPVAAMLGLPVGFGSNFMSAVRSGRRIVLQNGYHRAYALRRVGITHAPCIIEEVTRKDELRVGGDAEVNADPEFYFAATRPPLLKDFFDPRFAKLLPVRPIETVVEVEMRVRSGTATDWSQPPSGS